MWPMFGPNSPWSVSSMSSHRLLFLLKWFLHYILKLPTAYRTTNNRNNYIQPTNVAFFLSFSSVMLTFTHFLLYSSLSLFTFASTLYRALTSGVMVSIWTPTPSGCVHVTPGPWRVSKRSPCLRTWVKLQMVPGSLDSGPSVCTATSRVNGCRYCGRCRACCSWVSSSLFLLSSSWTLARKQRNRRLRVFSTWMLEPRSFRRALVTAPDPVGTLQTGPGGVSEKNSELMVAKKKKKERVKEKIIQLRLCVAWTQQISVVVSLISACSFRSPLPQDASPHNADAESDWGAEDGGPWPSQLDVYPDTVTWTPLQHTLSNSNPKKSFERHRGHHHLLEELELWRRPQ